MDYNKRHTWFGGERGSMDGFRRSVIYDLALAAVVRRRMRVFPVGCCGRCKRTSIMRWSMLAARL